MGDYAPPTGPPPPKVPEGWKAVWNDQYKEWFYVNTYTKKSQWDKPTEPVYGPPGDRSPAGPPPSYDHSNSRPVGPDKGGMGSNNPYSGNTNDDEALARRLQAEEAARARGSSDRGASDSYYNNSSSPNTSNNPYGTNPNLSAPQPGGPPYASASSPAPPEKRGLFSKLTGGGTSPRPPSQGRGYGGYPPQQPGYGGYPPQGPPPGPQYGQPYGGGGYPGYYPPQQQQAQYQQQQPQQKHGLGAGGGALLGAGAGLLGGALLMDAFEDHSQAEYQQGFDNGEMADNGGYGGDDGGGDYGGDGGDFGGDF